MRLSGEGAPKPDLAMQLLNRKFSRLGREDLLLMDPVLPEELDPLYEIPVTNSAGYNFAARWRMPGLTSEQILQLATIPKQKDVGQFAQTVMSERYPGVSVVNFAAIPVFTRMLISRPYFTTKLVIKISDVPFGHDFKAHEDELLEAYKIMSGLVDRSDLALLDGNGAVFRNYLTN